LRNIRWVNAQGVVVVAGKLQRCHLPVKLADEALRAGMVAHVGDARIRHQIGSWGMIQPLATNCEWVGHEAKPEPTPTAYQPAIPHSTFGNFQVVDRGPPLVGRMPVQQIEATGTRSAPEERIAMLKVVGVLNTGEPVKGIIVNPHGVEVPEHVPILDSHNIANGGLGHVERTWTEDDSLMGELVFTGARGARAGWPRHGEVDTRRP
jgi:hypothetical protein